MEKPTGNRPYAVHICKSKRELIVVDAYGESVFCASVALGRVSMGHKQWEGDGKTPEGSYRICLIKEEGKYGKSLGLSYPNPADANAALLDGRIDAATHAAILSAHEERRRPPWGSPLGGEIYIHAGGTHSDWTQGCIALNADDMERLYKMALQDGLEQVEIVP